jgi:tRNA A-37 threonylcarbamoyl transferase component Bud32
MEMLNLILQWIVAPVAAFVWLLHRQSQSQATDIAVIKAQMAATKEAHDREFKQVKDSFAKVIEKLDNIEQHLRK